MIDITNVRVKKEETHLFISTADADEVEWLLKQAGATDFEIYPRHMILNRKVKAIQNLSDEEREKELKEMYGERSTTMMRIASVIISHYNADDLFGMLKPIIVDNKRDEDYNSFYWAENAKCQQDEWPVE